MTTARRARPVYRVGFGVRVCGYLLNTVLSVVVCLFVVFAARRRNCVGQSFAMHEMKVTIARILRRYNHQHHHHTTLLLKQPTTYLNRL